ncbi:hypothetical protein PT974_04308 [Cladobotryum mycophilum]|uniref:Uncharacterized protein n=1 Tax=Cladobotryum mycophilum TaxID=491253 RepID=A0ABR0SUN0_9HYPO
MRAFIPIKIRKHVRIVSAVKATSFPNVYLHQRNETVSKISDIQNMEELGWIQEAAQTKSANIRHLAEVSSKMKRQAA